MESLLAPEPVPVPGVKRLSGKCIKFVNYDLWKRLDEVSPEELERDGHNPVLHITIHQIIENQIAANDPPETAKILQLLIQQGLSRHEAIHQIGTLLAKDIFEAAKSDQAFNKQHYVRRLRQLVRPQRKKGRRGII